MTEKRFTIKPQDDLFGVVDNYSPDKICVINGIRTEIEAGWLCNLLNELHEDLKHELKVSKALRDVVTELEKENKELSEQVEYLKKQVKIFRGECNRLTKENTELLEELND